LLWETEERKVLEEDSTSQTSELLAEEEKEIIPNTENVPNPV
jgi:hypothetical protein